MIGRKSHPPFLSGRRQGQQVGARSGQGLVFKCLGSSILHYSPTLLLTGCLGHFLLAVGQVLCLPSCWVSLPQLHTHPSFLLGLPSSHFLVGLLLASARPLFMLSVRDSTFLLVELRNARLLIKC